MNKFKFKTSHVTFTTDLSINYHKAKIFTKRPTKSSVCLQDLFKHLIFIQPKTNSKDVINLEIFYFRCAKSETVKKKDGNLIELNEKNSSDSEYDPYKNRKVEHPTT